MTKLQQILDQFRSHSVTEREKGGYFEQLVLFYLAHEPKYRQIYSEIATYADWANRHNLPANDDGIDLVATPRIRAGAGDNAVGEAEPQYAAVQCKLYSKEHSVSKDDIDTFLSASGKKYFSQRIIVDTSDKWSRPAENTIIDQRPPILRITQRDLEQSVIDWSRYSPTQSGKRDILKPRKALLPHQQVAITATLSGFQQHDRGKLIMACGTGKTLTSLKIAEQQCGLGKRVLFMVPSLALLSQSLTEWTQQSQAPLCCFAVCSDSHIGKHSRRSTAGGILVGNEDRIDMQTHELAYPATTDALTLAKQMAAQHSDSSMTVIFATYHSIEVVKQAQQQHAMPDFDLIICDEAHRTTGATFADSNESNFVKIHSNQHIRGAKRLYMTATPRIYGDNDKSRAKNEDIALCSMDDTAQYGDTFHTLSFSSAVSQRLLVDYKVIVLTIDESYVSEQLQDYLKTDNGNELNLSDAAKIVGCWKALNKHTAHQPAPAESPPIPMSRAVAYCQVIDPVPSVANPATPNPAKTPAKLKRQTHKVSSRRIAEQFTAVVESYREQQPSDGLLQCQADHIDGTMNATQKNRLIDWLKSDVQKDHCRILCNVRCLSEGIDVPALDAVLFLSPRGSQVEVVQSVGRVMRRAEGKQLGYVILPVVIPSNTTPEQALNDNKSYKVVWEVLQALRAHDDHFDHFINKIDLLNNPSGKIEIIPIAKIAPKLKQDKKSLNASQASRSNSIGQTQEPPADYQSDLFAVSEIEKGLYAKIVQKCGKRLYWEEWAADIARIAQTHITRIAAAVQADGSTRATFLEFVQELHKNINNSITQQEVIEMLAQHLITQPVFEALFSNNQFSDQNPVSRAMQKALDQLPQMQSERDTLQNFYNNIKSRAQGIDNAAGKQKIIVELYDKFFRKAFPQMTERLGIVYTPIPCVDFIIHSVQHLLQTQFNQTLASPHTHIIDPFTGTGTFITRLLQSGLIPPNELPHKYNTELHANEIVLLAYYIASINIETTYHDIIKQNNQQPTYTPFSGICLTDSFQLYEDSQDIFTPKLPYNSQRLNRQKNLTDIRVIIGNPPYSAGQKSGNDNNQNLKYPKLDNQIQHHYAEPSTAANKNSLYDSYIRAIRWATDRLGSNGIIGFITSAGWIDGNAMDGLRQSLQQEFSSIYIFHLRGNARTQGEQRQKEAGNIFGEGSRAPIAITLLVKNPTANQHGQIYYHDIGDYLTREQKLQKITQLKSIANITAQNAWQTITPDQHHDWLDQRDNSFYSHIIIGDKKSNSKVIFTNYSQGLGTSRDAWVYNASPTQLADNIQRTINFYNSELQRYHQSTAKAQQPNSKQQAEKHIAQFVNNDSGQISWSRGFRYNIFEQKTKLYKPQAITQALYRPFTKTNIYYDGSVINDLGQMLQIFPEAGIDNLVIAVTGRGSTKDFSCIVSNIIPDLELISKSQCFPLKLYTPINPTNPKDQALFHTNPDTIKTAPNGNQYHQTDAITDAGLKHFTDYYKGGSITKTDLFYYIYGLLHSPHYRTRYANNLSKDLPHIPRVKSYDEFNTFTQAGKQLADLHLNYENQQPHPALTCNNGQPLTALDNLPDHQFTVRKMKFKTKTDKSTIIYNDHIVIENIPATAYQYIVNGRSAIEWVMERQQITTHKDSNITNDPNHYATQTQNSPRYPLDLLLKIITTSLDSVKIITTLPTPTLE